MKLDVLVAGTAPEGKPAEGLALVLSAPISFWGGVNPFTGAIVLESHPERGENVAGRVLVLPGTVGSSSASAVLLELVYSKQAPAAILMPEPDAILLLGLIVAREMGWQIPPAYRMAAVDQAKLRGRHVRIDATGNVSFG